MSSNVNEKLKAVTDVGGRGHKIMIYFTIVAFWLAARGPWTIWHTSVRIESIRESVADFDPYDKAKMSLLTPISSQKSASILCRSRLSLDSSQPW